MPEYITHNIVTTPEEDAIVTAVQKRIGASEKQGYSTAVRFIIREFALRADPEGKILKDFPKPTTHKRRTKKMLKNLADIPGVRKGVTA